MATVHREVDGLRLHTIGAPGSRLEADGCYMICEARPAVLGALTRPFLPAGGLRSSEQRAGGNGPAGPRASSAGRVHGAGRHP